MKDVGRPGSLHGLSSRDLDSFCAGDVGPTQARIVQILDALNHHHPTTPPPLISCKYQAEGAPCGGQLHNYQPILLP